MNSATGLGYIDPLLYPALFKDGESETETRAKRRVGPRTPVGSGLYYTATPMTPGAMLIAFLLAPLHRLGVGSLQLFRRV